MNTVIFLPPGGVNVLTCFFSSSPSMDSQKFPGVVALEKFILLNSICSESNFIVYIRITEVLAVPGPPTKRELLWHNSFLFLALHSGRPLILVIIYSALVESPVGIKSYENMILFGICHSAASHIFHCFVVSSTQ